MRASVSRLDDDRKVNYNIMVARTNLNNLWFYDDFRLQLAVSCPSTTSNILKASQMALEKGDRKAAAARIALARLQGMPQFIDG